jgi:hypothetical protein
MSYFEDDDDFIEKEVQKLIAQKKEQDKLKKVDFQTFLANFSKKRKAEPMSPAFKALRLWLTTQSDVRTSLSKLVYYDKVMMMFNDKSVKNNIIFTLSQEYAMYLMSLNPRIKVEPFYATVITDSSGGTGKSSNTTQVSDIFTRETKTIKANFGIAKKKVVLFGLRVKRLRNPRTETYMDLVVKPFATFRRMLLLEGKFVSAIDLIDRILKLNKKIFEGSGKSEKSEVRKNTTEIKNLHDNLLEIRDVIDEYSVLQLDYLRQWKMSSDGVVFALSPVRFFDIRNKKADEEPRVLNPWLNKVFSSWLN